MENKINIYNDIKYLKGVGEARSKLLNKMNIFSIKDLIEFYPRVYEDRTKLMNISEFINGESYLFQGKLYKNYIKIYRPSRKLTIIKGLFSDGTSFIELTWYNMPYLQDFFKDNTEYIFYGKCEIDKGRFVMNSPVIYNKYELLKIMGLYPIYPLTKGLTQKYMFNLVSSVLENNNLFNETINETIRRKYNLCDINFAINNIHMPKNYEDVTRARNRIIFEELFRLTVALNLLKSSNIKNKKLNKFTNINIDKFLELIPFKLTNAQNKVVEEIKNDMASDYSMNRMIEGDVGSGKTIVAAIAIFIAIENGYQAAMMAPTTILATQHYLELKEYFDKLGYKSDILTSNTTKKQKNKIIEDLSSGKIDIIFGTHAMLEDNIIFKNLGIVITDEQHRFGVKQRMKLTNKSSDVETLVMSATPIPRTLALMVYGDLSLSIIDELPPGRKKIATFAVGPSFEERVTNFIIKQIENNRQAYIVCPLVEENEDSNIMSVEELYKKYKEGPLSKYNVAYIHGKMKNKEKDEIMNKFKNNEISVLISTTVIEVGVNVPNATLMVIENAERFGLAALHQLRGRVGRGKNESYCILKSNSKSEKAIERLKIMEKSNNGFEIAERDLELRGPGDFFGTRQSGLPEFKLADLLKDMKVLKIASDAAKEILLDDPLLSKEENFNLKKSLYENYKEELNNISL